MAKAFLTGQSRISERLWFCHAAGCVEKVTRSTAAGCWCLPHWRLIPSDLRTLLERKFRPARRADTAWTQMFATFMHQAQRELASIALTWHRIPKPAEFMWDDPPAEGAGGVGKDDAK